MEGTIEAQRELWKELPPFRDAETCIAAGVTWALKLANPELVIPPNVEELINRAKFGQCKDNIPLSWILGTMTVFKEEEVKIIVENPEYMIELRESTPPGFSKRVGIEFGMINAREIKRGEYGICAVLVDKFMLDGIMHIAHTVTAEPQAEAGDWFTYSDPWSGKQTAKLPDSRFDEALFGLQWLLGWGKMLVSVG